MSKNSVIFALFSISVLSGQAVDDTQLKQVIIIGRHGVRAPVAANSTINAFSARPYPAFSTAPGILTDNGAKLETILGGYYRQWLTREGLLTGNDPADAPFVYMHANTLQRTIASAQAFAAGMLPGAGVNVISRPASDSDPLFDPVGAGVARLDPLKAVAAVKGRLGGHPQSLTSAYAAELALTRSVLFGYPAGQIPVPGTPVATVDVTAIPIDVTAGGSGTPVHLGGLEAVLMAVDPFIMQYAEGMPSSDVGWGQLNVDGISQTSRLYNLPFDLVYRTPYLTGVLSSNLASHVVRSMVQASTGDAMKGSLGNPSTKVILLVASDVNIIGLAALFHLDWLLPGYQQDFCGPGGALVFELRQSQSTGEYIVRASYVAQTLDQLRNRAALTLSSPPASAPVFIPGCSLRNATFDCPLASFATLAKQVIDPESADRVN